LVNLTRATFRIAEFGFFGVVVYTRVQTPRFCGLLSSAGTVLLTIFDDLGLRTNWFVVAMGLLNP
jgi:hypothetical protein